MDKDNNNGNQEKRPLTGSNDDPALDPYEIEFLPQFTEDRGPRAPFVNQYGVVIGDHDYESSNSPLEQWTEETDPSVMAGDEWVHSFKDIGFQSAENRDYFEKGIPPQSGVFMHPDKDVAYGYELGGKADGSNDGNVGSDASIDHSNGKAEDK